MFRFTIRELVLLTLVVAVSVAWWIDRSRLALPFADYQRLKVEEAKVSADNREVFKILRTMMPTDEAQVLAEKPAPIRPVPGDKDYQFPPEFPLHYGPSRTN